MFTLWIHTVGFIYKLVYIMNSGYDICIWFHILFWTCQRQPEPGVPQWSLLGQASKVHANGRVLLGQERRGPHPAGVPQGQRVCCWPCAATVSWCICFSPLFFTLVPLFFTLSPHPPLFFATPPFFLATDVFSYVHSLLWSHTTHQTASQLCCVASE